MALSNIGKGAIISYIGIFLNLAISFFYTPWMLKQIGVSDYGLYSLISAFISYFVIDFGLSGAITRFIAKYRAEGNHRKIENILGLTLKIFFIIDVAIFMCLLVCYFFISDIFTGLTVDEIERLKILYIIASSFSLLSFALKPLDGALNAFELYVPSKLIDMTYKVGSVMLIIIALLLGGNVYVLVLIHGFLSFLTSVYRYFYWHKRTGLTPNLNYKEKSTAIELFSFSGWTFAIGLAQRFRLNFIPTVLGILSNSSQITIFGLGMTIEAMMWTMSSALNGMFLPKVTRLCYNNDDKGIMDLMLKLGRIQLYLVFGLFSGFFVFGKSFIKLWIGSEYSDVYYIVLCLICAYLFSTTMRTASDKVLADNKVSHTAKATFITSLLGLIGSVYVAKTHGALGCAVCSGVALVITQGAYIKIYEKQLKIDIKYFCRKCYLKILPLLCFYAVLFYVVLIFIDINSWAILFITAFIYVMCYLGISYLFLFNEYEKKLVKTILMIKD